MCPQICHFYYVYFTFSFTGASAHFPFLFAVCVPIITLHFEWATFRCRENMSKTGNLFLFQFYLTSKNQYEGGFF